MLGVYEFMCASCWVCSGFGRTTSAHARFCLMASPSTTARASIPVRAAFLQRLVAGRGYHREWCGGGGGMDEAVVAAAAAATGTDKE